MKHRVELLGWFLWFLNLKLEKLSPPEAMKVVTELEGAIRGAFYGGMVGDFPFADLIIQTRKTWGEQNPHLEGLLANGGHEIKKLQQVLGHLVESIYERFENAKNHVDTHLSPDRLDSLSSLARIKVTLDVEATIAAQRWTHGDGDDALWEKAQMEEATCKLKTEASNFEDAIKFQFLSSFDGQSLSALRKCPVCGNWFLHLSKRQREFCSQKCAAKKTSRVRYKRLKESDPASYEKELVEGRRRARKSHLEKKKAEFGANVKVQRRPRKPREKED